MKPIVQLFVIYAVMFVFVFCVGPCSVNAQPYLKASPEDMCLPRVEVVSDG